jgi:RNA-binding protein YhbY
MNIEKKRARDRRNRHTEGTYRYKECHGLGRPGLTAYITRRTRDLLREREIVAIKLLESEEDIKNIYRELGRLDLYEPNLV